MDSPAPTGPVSGAVVLHEPGGDRLAAFALETGHVRPLGAAGAAIEALALSPDGGAIAYLSTGTLWLYREGVAADLALVRGVLRRTGTLFAFSHDGRWIAAASGEDLVIARVPAAAEEAKPGRVPLDKGSEITDLRWAPDGATVLALCSPAPGAEEPRLAGVSAASQKAALHSAPGVNRLLGFRPGGELIVARTNGAGEEASLLLPSGELRPLRPAQENEFLLLYLPAIERFIVAQGGEDLGDPTVLGIGDVSADPSVPWLSAHPRVTDLHVSSDARRALFVERPAVERPLAGGDVYLASLDETPARRVLEATDERSYSLPVLGRMGA